MKALHKISIAFMAALLLVGGAFAQDATTQSAPAQNQPNAAPMRKHMGRSPMQMRMHEMARRLNLTDDQKVKIQPILQNEMQQARALHQDTSLTPEQRQQKMQELRQSSQDQMKQVLTPEQVAKLDNPPAMRRNGAHGNPLEMMSKRLNLTDDQKAKLEPMFADQQKQVQAVKQDSSLTPEQRQAKIREIRKATHEQVIGVLTPEQQAQMKQARGKGMHRRGGPGGPPTPSANPQVAPQSAPPQGF